MSRGSHHDTLEYMNSGTGWTKRHKQMQMPAVIAEPDIEHPSHRLFIWLLVLVVLPASIAAGFLVLSAKTKADEQIAQSALSREQAYVTYGLLKQRLTQESAYRQYARRVATTMITAGTANLSGAPALSKWGHNDPTKLDSIVNKQHPIYPLNFVPQLADIPCGSGGTAELVPSAKDDFTALCEAAAGAGVPLLVTSSYRSYTDQIDIYHWWVTSRGEAAAERASALPGYSEHQLGLSVDFATPSGLSLESFEGSPQQQWLHENSWKYGFIQRYTETDQQISGYDVEAWHYRYVGRAVATAYMKSGATSLEQYWHVSGGSYDKAVYTTMPAEAK